MVSARSRGTESSSDNSQGLWIAQRAGIPDQTPFDLLRLHEKDGHMTFESLRVAGLDNMGSITSMDVIDSPSGPLLWIGGSGGLLRIEMNRVHLAGAPRHIQMREIRVEGKTTRELDIHPTRQIRIDPDIERIQFAFSAAQPMEAAQLSVYYQTRLEGVEDDWTAPSRKNTREFTGLAAGSYVFMARRLDRHGMGGDAIRYPFSVLPPWYERWPAYLVYALGLLGAATLVMQYRLRLLRQQTDRLDRLVASRTRELELSNTAKSEFLETISHEIRNPLNGIVGLANLLKTENLPPDEARVARSLQTSSEHLRRVAEDVLGFSRLEFGQISVEATQFSLKKTLEELVARSMEQAQRQRNSISLVLPETKEEYFVGDQQKIRTIISNFPKQRP